MTLLPLQRGQGSGGLTGGDIGAVSAHPELHGDVCHQLQDGVRKLDPGQQLPGAQYLAAQRLLHGGERNTEELGVREETLAAADHLYAVLAGLLTLDLHAQPEAVLQLGTQLALLGVHGADHDERGRMGI